MRSEKYRSHGVLQVLGRLAVLLRVGFRDIERENSLKINAVVQERDSGGFNQCVLTSGDGEQQLTSGVYVEVEPKGYVVDTDVRKSRNQLCPAAQKVIRHIFPLFLALFLLLQVSSFLFHLLVEMASGISRFLWFLVSVNSFSIVLAKLLERSQYT